ncbi:MAG: hypothetical protein NXY57DRAFT_967871 [Lentinula lateritia]|nr:MAG: hypothetical protein NXY57DRAFT_967871 [Lentinula lateritia]
MSSTTSVPPIVSGDANPPSPTTTPNTTTTSTTANSSSSSSPSSYPSQHHAGAVGYGPNYRQGASLTDKLTGLKEELKGKVTKNPGLVEHGREMKSGELKKKEEEEDMNNLDPFGTADDDDEKNEKKKEVDSSTKSPDSTSTPSTTDTSSAFGTANTSTPPQPAYPTGSIAKRDAQGQQVNSDGAGVTTTETESGVAKPRDVKYIDEDRSGEHHHHHHHHHHNNNHNNNSTHHDGSSNAVASEPGQIASDAVHV